MCPLNVQDDRIDVVYMPGIGVDLQLTGLTRGDTGTYKCTVNVNKKAIDVTHTVGFNLEGILLNFYI